VKPYAWFVVAIAGAAALVAPLAVKSQSIFEKLVMPGPLIQGHEKLEKNCGSCHESFSRQSQKRLCLDCHKDVAEDAAGKKGFHGRQPEVAANECRHCHTDHKGRAADIVRFDRETFNHAFADFALEGAHKSAPCEGCHKAGTKFRAAPGRCVACHKAAEPHKGRLGDDCGACHGVDSWSRVKPFDHAKTRFPLAGAHARVACAVCHAGERYKNLPANCSSCHGQEDAHNGRYGGKCETCHGQAKWKAARFDHAKSTKFPLAGAHATVRCDACHAGDLYRDKLSSACAACHKTDDPHKGQLGPRCEQCHNEASWRRKVAFDHDITRFPLIGKHAVLPCEECHKTTAFKDTPRACAECHKDGHHEGRLGPRCAECHNPAGWERWRFDHDALTKFPLTGAHEGLHCHACHAAKGVTKAAASTACADCHMGDDAHQGAFGRACEKCHSTVSFRDAMGRRR